MSRIRVLVVEDSALMRRVIGDIVKNHPGLELMGTARDGLDALEKIRADRPDVVTMDLEMPRLDGLQTLNIIMKEVPLPVIMLSNHTRSGSESTMKALEAGAVDFIPKPLGGDQEQSLEELGNILPEKLIAAASVRVGLITAAGRAVFKETPGRKAGSARMEAARVIIAIGASTGGPRALEKIFNNLPADLPAAILLSQHMPPGFTLSLSQRLDQVSSLQVKEAEKGDQLLTGRALVAPGGYHLTLSGSSVVLDSGPKVNFVRPSIDVMLESLAGSRQSVIVVILTGMGRDGAAGAALLNKKKPGTVFIAQDAATALIPSMPEALAGSVGCEARVPLDRIAVEIERYARVKA